MTRIVLFTIVVCLSLASSAQSGWTKPQSELFAQFNYTGWATTRYFNTSGTPLHEDKYHYREWSVYSEYGILPRFTLIAYFPIYKLQYFTNTEKASGIGDLRLEGKLGLLKSKVPLSFSVAVEMPTGRPNFLSRSFFFS